MGIIVNTFWRPVKMQLKKKHYADTADHFLPDYLRNTGDTTSLILEDYQLL